MDDIYKKIFGEVKVGSEYSTQGKFGGGYNSDSLRSAMQKFRNYIHGGTASKNLSSENADLIISVIEPYLKNLPVGGKLSYSTKAAMGQQLWHYVQAGKLSQADYDDAKKIISLF